MADIIKFPKTSSEKEKIKTKKKAKNLKVQDFFNTPQKVPSRKILEIINKFKNFEKSKRIRIWWSIWCAYCGEEMTFYKIDDVIDFIEFHTTYCDDSFYFEINL